MFGTKDITTLGATLARGAALSSGTTGGCGASLGSRIAASTLRTGRLTLALPGVGIALLSGTALDTGAFVFVTASSVGAANIRGLAISIAAADMTQAILEAALLTSRTLGTDTRATARDRHTHRLVLTQGQTTVLGVVGTTAADAAIFCTKLVALTIFDTFALQAAIGVFGAGFAPTFFGDTLTIVVWVGSLACWTSRTFAFFFGA